MPTVATSLNIENVQFHQQSGAASTPATDYWRLYFKSDGLYQKDSAGTESKLAYAAGTITQLTIARGSTTSPVATLTVSETYAPTSGAGSDIANGFSLAFSDDRRTTNLSNQIFRFVYTREATATNGASAFDAAIILATVFNASLSNNMYGMAIEGPVVAATKTLTEWSALRLQNGSGSGAITTQYGLYVEGLTKGSGNFSIWTNDGIVRLGDTVITEKADAATNSVTNTIDIRHNSSGTPAAGFGTGILIRGESSSTADRELIRIRGAWTTATDGSRAARGTMSAYDTAERDCLMWEASGSATMLGFQGTAPIVKPTVTGSKGANAALTSLLTALANYGLITDSSS